MTTHSDQTADELQHRISAGDECPNCRCGTIEETEDEFACRGECGTTWPRVQR